MKMPLLLIFAACCVGAMAQSPASYVDPRIGSEGLGRAYIGPTVPYGMIKPSVDAVSMPNSGWAPMPQPILGFAQTHVSGTGGGQKYGNILLMPYCGEISGKTVLTDLRRSEVIDLGYYATALESGIKVDVTAAHSAAIYRFGYPDGQEAGLAVDAGFFLGTSPIPDQRETQQLVGSQIEIVSDRAIKGYSRVRGGWNDGRAYTVYFYAETDKPFDCAGTWKDDSLSSQSWQADTGRPTGAYLDFGSDAGTVTVKIAISYLSELKARENLRREIPHWDFDQVRRSLTDRWNEVLSRVEVDPSTSDSLKTMLYTGLYHTMLMPTERTGENPLWNYPVPYYDDYYAIWDTYRTSMPLLTLIEPKRQSDMVNSLLNIYKRDGYLPDARSGNCNGRTQGGSNAEIAIADAFVKGLDGIDWNLALEAMLRDANDAPGGKQEAEGRGGLEQYNALGYIPHGIPRAGNRTVEYSYCDFAIAQVAEGLGRDDIRERFSRQASNWRNLWRADYEHEGVKGFIMPRDAEGHWLDSLQQGHSALIRPTYAYTPVTFEGPWYTPWWDMFFYEASSWEYSLSVPHDIPALIEICGGTDAFERRLDTFFDKGFYNVNNEPSFLTPCLYHWLGKPWRSSERVREIISENFDSSAMGLPGNDDSGAMSSWLAFHLIGLYPNAGQDYYLINSPMIKSTTFHLDNGKDFTIEAKGLSDSNRYVEKATLDGEAYPHAYIRHADVVKGGRLVLTMGPAPSDWGRSSRPQGVVPHVASAPIRAGEIELPSARSMRQSLERKLRFTFKLHGQTRRYDVRFLWHGDTLVYDWGIERNLKWQSGSFIMLPEAVADADVLSLRMPVDGECVTLASDATAYIISRRALAELKSCGRTRINRADFAVADDVDGYLHIINAEEGTEMWVLDHSELPLICRMAGNPLEVDWLVSVNF